MVLRDPLTMLVAISFTAYGDDKFAKKRVVSYCYIKKALVVPVGTTNAGVFWTPPACGHRGAPLFIEELSRSD